MNTTTNPLVKTNFSTPKSKPTNDLNSNTTNNLKLSFNNDSSLNLYVVISGISGKEYLGKSFLIKRPLNKSDLFFQKLYNTIEKNNDISLIKNKSTDGTSFWTKGSFEISSNNTIIFNIKDDVISNDSEVRLNKLIRTINKLDIKSNTTVLEKYLDGFLEEKGIISFNDYINYHI